MKEDAVSPIGGRVHAVTISDEACYAHVEEGGKRAIVPLTGSALVVAMALLASVRAAGVAVTKDGDVVATEREE